MHQSELYLLGFKPILLCEESPSLVSTCATNSWLRASQKPALALRQELLLYKIAEYPRQQAYSLGTGNRIAILCPQDFRTDVKICAAHHVVMVQKAATEIFCTMPSRT